MKKALEKAQKNSKTYTVELGEGSDEIDSLEAIFCDGTCRLRYLSLVKPELREQCSYCGDVGDRIVTMRFWDEDDMDLDEIATVIKIIARKQ